MIRLSEKIATKQKTVVFTFGRFNPPTLGHEKLINKIITTAKKLGGQPRVYLSHSEDSKTNPLKYNDKLRAMKQIFPSNIFVSSKNIRTLYDVIFALQAEGIANVVLVLGDDRVADLQTQLYAFVKKSKDVSFENFEVISAGKRNPRTSGAAGMSASKMRDHAASGKLQFFLSGLPQNTSWALGRYLYDMVRKGLGIKEARDYKREYEMYHGTPEQRMRRSQRNQARQLMIRWGKAAVGDGMDVHHADHNTENNTPENLESVPISLNRADNRNHGRVSFKNFLETKKR